MRILFAEDDSVSRRRLSAVLTKWGYKVLQACDGNEAWQVLQHSGAPQLAILDWMMPGLDGIEVCHRVRQLRNEPYTYLLLLTAKTQQEDIVAGLEAGADDYLTKPFSLHELQIRLRAGRRILDLQAALISAREKLRTQATHDPLTGLWNRAAIFEVLRREMARAERAGAPLSIIMADVDHFKRVNDVYGHPAGDEVLCEVAQRIRTSRRPYDEVGRYGGEEFLLVLSYCGAQEAAQVAERLRACVEEQPVETLEGKLFVTASFGVATRQRVKEADMETFLHAADTALYRAKQGGRNRVALAKTDKAIPSLPLCLPTPCRISHRQIQLVSILEKEEA
jgi:two-component system cell cycle response regulator